MNPEVFVIELGDGTFVTIDAGSGYPSYMAFNYAKMFGDRVDAELYAKSFSSDFVDNHRGYQIKQVMGFAYKTEDVAERTMTTCSELKPGMVVEIPACWDDELETDFDAGCLAKVTNIQRKGHDGVIMLVLDWSAYQEHNKSKFKANYFDTNGVPCLRFHETKGFTEKDITSNCVYVDEETKILLVGGTK